MSGKVKLVVKTDVGTFTRTTGRTYTHIVVALDFNADVLRKWSAENVVYCTGKAKESQEIADGRRPREYASSSVEDYARYAEQYRTEVAEAPVKLEQRLAQSAASTHGVMGWTGRPDLAQALYSKTVAEGRMDVRIYDVTTGERVR